MPPAAIAALARIALRKIPLTLCLAGALAVPVTLAAQGRTLDWPSIAVTAHLDADGRLRVSERQEIRFIGDWNGGDRRFDLRLNHELALLRLSRLDAAGVAHELVEGELTAVDEFAWSNGSTLRWRSRLPTDPPFDGTVITYLLEYELGRILVRQDGGGFLLDHDFLFADRSGPVARYSLSLTVDTAWRVPDGFAVERSASDLPPGESFVVRVPLAYAGAGAPASVIVAAPRTLRLGLAAALLVAIVTLLVRLLGHERRLGRFAPPPQPGHLTPEWLAEHLFTLPPEVIGAAWDDTTGSAEVAAILARLVQEGKLASRVETTQVWILRNDVLHLTLKVERDVLAAHERVLVDALFRPGEESTDTGRVRERYKATGFDPAALIRPRLTQWAEATAPGSKGKAPAKRGTMLLLAAALALLAAGAWGRMGDLMIAALALGASLPLYVVGCAMAYAWRRAPRGLLARGLWSLVPLGAMVVLLLLFILLRDTFPLAPLTVAGLALWVLALANSLGNVARTRESTERVARRQRLVAARDFFRAELARPEPQLQDAWFPYVIAFGLGRHIDKWFRAFGGDVARTSGAIGMIGSAGGSSGSGGSGWSGFGGGGGFAGAGASAAFASAVGGMAASVAAPSSSSSGGGGGGGGSSSGGGGGGGW